MTVTQPATRTVLLGAYAARSCPVKTQNAYDSTIALPSAAPDLAGDAAGPGLAGAGLWDGAARFTAQVLDELINVCRGRVVDLRLLAYEGQDAETRACLQALSTGAEVVIGARLPPDRDGHRVGRPDVLVRGTDAPDGRPGYHPVVVKWHKILDRSHRPPEEEPASVWCSTLAGPAPDQAAELAEHGLRLGRREADFTQLAHYHRMLQAAGYAAAGHPLAAVIGSDRLFPSPVLAWVDLSVPVIRTFSRSQPEGWRLRSPLERYDHEHGFRVDIATVASQQTGDPEHDPGLLVRPVVNGECVRCPWWEHCRTRLDPDDVSLRIDKGALDRREITTLRNRGIVTIQDLVGTDLDQLLPSYLPEVSHRGGAEPRLRVAVRRARMLLDDVDFHRETTGPAELPTADVEIDFDIESSADGRIYLWGFLVDAGTGSGVYHEFSRFDDLDARAETTLALEAFGWLRDLIQTAKSVTIYHYSGYEVARISELAQRETHELLDWAAAYAAAEFLDLLETVKTHYFGVNGLGLKLIARHAGFRWRDDDPGGLNSQHWFAEAVHSEDADVRAQARTRVLEYNEDDVLATHHLRAWLRAQ